MISSVKKFRSNLDGMTRYKAIMTTRVMKRPVRDIVLWNSSSSRAIATAAKTVIVTLVLGDIFKILYPE